MSHELVYDHVRTAAQAFPQLWSKQLIYTDKENVGKLSEAAKSDVRKSKVTMSHM